MTEKFRKTKMQDVAGKTICPLFSGKTTKLVGM